MNVNYEFCNPFTKSEQNIWMKIEHCGRYLFACDRILAHNGKFIIDAACADGYGSYMMADTGCSVIGLDCNKKYIEIANTKKSHSAVEFLIMDFDKDSSPIPSCSQDMAICFETIEHVNTPKKLITFLYNSLKHGGVLLLSFPNAQYERFDENGHNKDPFHKHVFKKDEILTMLIQQGFSISNVLGQTICNIACLNQSNCQKKNIIKEEEFNHLFMNQEKAMRSYAYVLGYPSTFSIDNSYSYIIEAIKL